VVLVEEDDEFAALCRQEIAQHPAPAVPGAAAARLVGFDRDDRPLVSGIAALPGEIVEARTTVNLLRREIGATVVVVFEDGNSRRPIILGVVRDRQPAEEPTSSFSQTVSVQSDDNRLVLSAEREIVLKCGNASITLTRAGKVLINGTYVVSRSSGYNKIKGAAVDIN